MRLATWNLMRARVGAGRRTRELLRHIATVDADVWVLTETSEHLQPSPAHRLVSVSANAPDRDCSSGECWVAIWSRLPASPVESSADPRRSAAARVVQPDGAPMIVYGTVLPWLTDVLYTPVRGSAAFCTVLERQAAEWAELQRTHADAGFCVMGDFNQDLAAKHYYGSVKGRAALRAALDCSKLCCLTAGAGDPLTAFERRASIDHVCLDERTVERRRPTLLTWPGSPEELLRLTDHFGVSVELGS